MLFISVFVTASTLIPFIVEKSAACGVSVAVAVEAMRQHRKSVYDRLAYNEALISLWLSWFCSNGSLVLECAGSTDSGDELRSGKY